MLSNASCTLYRWNESKKTYDRIFMQKVYWQQTRTGRTLQSGDHSSDGTTVYFFGDVELPRNLEKDMLVKGNCSFQFSSGSESTLSSELKEFRQMYDFVVVYSVSDYNFGSLPHYEIYAK